MTYTSHDRPTLADGWYMGSATYQMVAAASPMTTIRSGSTPLGSRGVRTTASCRPYLGACRAANTVETSPIRVVDSSPIRGASGSTLVQSGVRGVPLLVAVQLTCGPLELWLMEDVGVCDK